jgi:hypothetical protein
MNVVNELPVEVVVLRITLGTGDIAAVAIVKSTFDLDARGALTPSTEPMPLVKQLLETPYGTFHSEFFFKKQGVDLCVLGSLCRTKPVAEARVRMSCGQPDVGTAGPRRSTVATLEGRAGAVSTRTIHDHAAQLRARVRRSGPGG